MHGLRRRVEDEIERTSKERRTDERGSLARGAVKAFRGCGGARDTDCHELVAATEGADERELLVPLTKRALRAAALSGTRTEGAAFMAVVDLFVKRLIIIESESEGKIDLKISKSQRWSK